MVSFRQDRSLDQIDAELQFITYLSENGVRVSTPLSSIHGNLIEQITIDEKPNYLVCFEKGSGMRVPDNGYRYR